MIFWLKSKKKIHTLNANSFCRGESKADLQLASERGRSLCPGARLGSPFATELLHIISNFSLF